MKPDLNRRPSERGSATTKFIIFLVGLVLIGNAGFNYVPAAYSAESLKTDMQTAVVQSLAASGKLNPVDMVKGKIQKAFAANDIPADAAMTVTMTGNSIQARVVYTKQVAILPFGIYNYPYKFDHTATPTGFLLKQ